MVFNNGALGKGVFLRFVFCFLCCLVLVGVTTLATQV